MPNWCANSVYLKAFNNDNIEKIQQVKQGIEKEEYFRLFNFFIPCPPELVDTAKKYPADPKAESNKEKFGYETWYEFNMSNWGTKWDASNITIEDSNKDSILLTFDTAWSPPQAWFDYMHDRGFYIEAMFIEQGCNFIGCYIAGESHIEDFNDGTLNYDDEDYSEKEEARIEKFMTENSLDHCPSHTGG